ncbi:hypothetical protein SAMN02745119_01218 [Trichlorobacter thiogenes]|uniref:Uncharacterized protein n=1 Tax=Trichlorobacter thiogenes TaxID=115783 RepID=A0A1T4MBH3_9BACT|nr:hypothetical protein [Trichlorobacter thiogenes]SJZ64369.1 hypothetical protein SAMN02745119_01218 [Trichlorobacter thiogenes]
MKKLFCAMALLLVWAVSAQASTVYLKYGGTIKAKRVWREKGKVVVLVNRDSITSFTPGEVNLKKTFPPRKKRVKRIVATPAVSTTTPGVTAPGAAPAPGTPTAKGDKKISLPSLPNKLPERPIPQASEEGAIRKQKREMEERMKE